MRGCSWVRWRQWDSYKPAPQSWISNKTWTSSLFQGGTRNFHGFDQNPTKVMVVEMACFEVLNLSFERIQNANYNRLKSISIKACCEKTNKQTNKPWTLMERKMHLKYCFKIDGKYTSRFNSSSSWKVERLLKWKMRMISLKKGFYVLCFLRCFLLLF